MPNVHMIMHKMLLGRAGRKYDRLDNICEAYYELLRAVKRQEVPDNPVGLLGVIADAINDAVHDGSVTPAEGLVFLSEALDWILPMVPQPLGPAPTALPPLGSTRYEDLNEPWPPLEILYDEAELDGEARVPSSVVPQLIEQQLL